MRLVALGASNLTRGLHAVVSAARQLWGPRAEILAALGHGRSYGASSSFLVRSLPGILQSGLWQALDEPDDPAPTRALVTDVGNDILYGYSASQVLEWVGQAVERLQRAGAEITVAGLPVEGIDRLSPGRFVFFRSLFVPSCGLSLAQAAATAQRVNEGLEQLARTRQLRFVRLRPEWYGLDPIHFRPACWTIAWRELLGVDTEDGFGQTAAARGPAFEALRLYLAVPERMRLLGLERRRPQPVFRDHGLRLSLY